MRSNKIRKAAQGQSCTLNVANVCCYDPATVVLCHAPSEYKGMALKSPDSWSAFGCIACHQWLDSNKGTEEDRKFYWYRGIERTQRRLFEQGILRVA